MTAQNNVYLSFGRHGRYGRDTAIDRKSMLEAFLTGRRLQKELPPAETVYYSPIARAVQTAEFRALGMECTHTLPVPQLSEETPAFVCRKFINTLTVQANENVFHYHFVTHLPVVEKLGLPDLGAGEICVCAAENWQEMLADNFSVTIWSLPEQEKTHALMRALALTEETMLTCSPVDIKAKIMALE